MSTQHRGMPQSSAVKDKIDERAAHFNSVARAINMIVSAMTKFVVAVTYLVVNVTDLFDLLT
ncbi:hypothetical protein FFA01_01750 [Frigoribacterium faeni]|uniref:Uncharacterized protein n=1 Tax=Frigoribacterium faeni TaxID=145483 RepID=A0A7W3JGK2_9MICO|nr:hypothetical protein [Frigoribacterium faeni]BFF13490.1 hypothetical protein GCM10025699_47930 [Microbacterium flavescens]GEK81866.1 hypothetical protein FFA01_01750 [Frigoribacterium faeni]